MKKYIIILELLLFIIINNSLIVITNYDIYTDKIDNEIKIVQVSDLHNKSFGIKQYKLINKIKKINPDLIVVTGDLIDANHTDIDSSIAFIERALNYAQVYYVTGNHESWGLDSYNSLKIKMEKLGVIILDNKSIDVEIENNLIEILGVDDANMVNVKTELDNLEYEDSTFNLLLTHRPELFSIYQNRNIDLVLTGHAHGGQFRIPFIGGLIAPDQGFFPEYSEGMFESNNTKMIVSRGLGNSIIPIRINNNPELVVVNIKHLDR